MRGYKKNSIGRLRCLTQFLVLIVVMLLATNEGLSEKSVMSSCDIFLNNHLIQADYYISGIVYISIRIFPYPVNLSHLPSDPYPYDYDNDYVVNENDDDSDGDGIPDDYDIKPDNTKVEIAINGDQYSSLSNYTYATVSWKISDSSEGTGWEDCIVWSYIFDSIDYSQIYTILIRVYKNDTLLSPQHTIASLKSDSDGDSHLDDVDAFPQDPTKWNKSEGQDQIDQRYIVVAGISFVLIGTSVTFLCWRRKQKENK